MKAVGMPADELYLPRIAGCRGSSDTQNSDSSSLRYADERNSKTLPPLTSLTGIYLRRSRKQSECTDCGSSEISYCSHPGYSRKPSQTKSPSSDTHVGQIQQQPQRQQAFHQSHQNQQTGSSCSASQSSSIPSSGVYVDVPLSLKLSDGVGSLTPTTSNGDRKLTKDVTSLKSRTIALSSKTSTTTTNMTLGTESESGYVVDSEKGNAYFKGQLLGKGGFARVYLITEIGTRQQYACKIISKHQMQKIHMQKIAREIMIHKELNHVNVVQMHHYFEDSLNVYMLLEACPKKSLVHVLKYRGKVTEPEARYYMKQMVSGVAYIHSQKVIHRDLKPGNMFLSEKMIVKIGDFGLATQFDGQRRRVTLCGTPNFIAPEVLFKQSYSYEADVWALGCILYALLVGQTPFDSSSLKETYSRICNHRYKEVDDTIATTAGQDLVRWLLQPNPELRPSLELVKEHPYLTKEYVPTNLPDSCCYQTPSLPYLEKINLSSALNCLPEQHSRHLVRNQEQVMQQHNQHAQLSPAPLHKSQENKKSKSKNKKKVSSWLASWRLPKFPRFRHRISGMMCLEARKKQLQLQQPRDEGEADLEAESSMTVKHIQLMSKALEECLTATARILWSKRNPPLVDNYAPLFVTKWIDYSNKYGLAFQLSDKSVGVLFNDGTKMSYTHDRRRIEYMTIGGEATKFNREQNVSTDLREKFELLRHFTDYMDKHLTEGGEITEQHQGGNTCQSELKRASKTGNVPLMRRWLRTNKAIIMELNIPLMQMNFLEDHTKLIISQQTQAGYFVTYIDSERRASTYRLDDLRDNGCSAELYERLLYIYKVTKEFAELDAAQSS